MERFRLRPLPPLLAPLALPALLGPLGPPLCGDMNEDLDADEGILSSIWLMLDVELNLLLPFVIVPEVLSLGLLLLLLLLSALSK